VITPDVLLPSGDRISLQNNVFQVVDDLEGSEALLTNMDQSFRVSSAALAAYEPFYVVEL
jgi:hypothetical protein